MNTVELENIQDNIRSSYASRELCLQPKWASGLVGVLGNGRAEDQTDDGSELHHDVQCWPRSVLQRVTDGVSGHGVLVGGRALAVVRAKATSLDVLLRVIPGTSCVAHGDCQLHAGYHCTGQESCSGVLSEAEAADEWGEDDQCAWCKHFTE